jgi:hypothetical protein
LCGFAKVGVAKEAIPDLVMKAATEGRIVSYRGKAPAAPSARSSSTANRRTVTYEYRPS